MGQKTNNGLDDYHSHMLRSSKKNLEEKKILRPFLSEVKFTNKKKTLCFKTPFNVNILKNPLDIRSKISKNNSISFIFQFYISLRKRETWIIDKEVHLFISPN